MRKSMISLALSATLFAPVTLAQSPEGGLTGEGPELRQQHGGKHMQARKDHLHKALDLSEEQATQIRELREQGASREEVRAVLTPEQQAQLDTLRASHDGKRREHMRNYLELSEEQMQQMREIRENGGSREDINAILSPEQQQKMAELHARRGHSRGGRPAE